MILSPPSINPSSCHRPTDRTYCDPNIAQYFLTTMHRCDTHQRQRRSQRRYRYCRWPVHVNGRVRRRFHACKPKSCLLNCEYWLRLPTNVRHDCVGSTVVFEDQVNYESRQPYMFATLTTKSIYWQVDFLSPLCVSLRSGNWYYLSASWCS